MQCLEVSGAVRPIYGSLGVKRLSYGGNYSIRMWHWWVTTGKVQADSFRVGCDTVRSGIYIPTFQRNLLPALSGVTPPPRGTPNVTYHNQLHQQHQLRGGSDATSQTKIGLLTLTRQTRRDSNPSVVGSRCGPTDRFVSWLGGPK